MMTREEVLSIISEVNGGLKAGTCDENGRWYIKHNRFDIRDFVLNWTSRIDAPFKEKMFYFKHNIQDPIMCSYCQVRRVTFSGISFQLSCSDVECKSKHKSGTSKKMHASMSDETRQRKNEAIGKANSGSLSERYEDERANEIRKAIGDASRGRKQSGETKTKRINSRRENNDEWHTDDTKQKISEGNKRTFASDEFKQRFDPIRKIIALKNSETMKRKVLNGEFTPNITNSWTRKKAFLVIDGQTRKFRSTWDAIFFAIKRNVEYEVVRIPYNDEIGRLRIYIVDFYDRDQKILYEVKPRSRFVNDLSKLEAGRNWAIENGHEFVVIDNDWFYAHANVIEEIVRSQPQLSGGMKQFIKDGTSQKFSMED